MLFYSFVPFSISLSSTFNSKLNLLPNKPRWGAVRIDVGEAPINNNPLSLDWMDDTNIPSSTTISRQPHQQLFEKSFFRGWLSSWRSLFLAQRRTSSMLRAIWKNSYQYFISVLSAKNRGIVSGVAQQILTKKWISKTSLYDGQDSMYEAQKISHSVLFAYSLLRLIST